jgi:hypothetical protein
MMEIFFLSPDCHHCVPLQLSQSKKELVLANEKLSILNQLSDEKLQWENKIKEYSSMNATSEQEVRMIGVFLL